MKNYKQRRHTSVSYCKTARLWTIFCLKPLRLSAKVHAVYWACTHSVCKSWVLPFCTVETLPKCVPVKVRLWRPRWRFIWMRCHKKVFTLSRLTSTCLLVTVRKWVNCTSGLVWRLVSTGQKCHLMRSATLTTLILHIRLTQKLGLITCVTTWLPVRKIVYNVHWILRWSMKLTQSWLTKRVHRWLFLVRLPKRVHNCTFEQIALLSLWRRKKTLRSTKNQRRFCYKMKVSRRLSVTLTWTTCTILVTRLWLTTSINHCVPTTRCSTTRTTLSAMVKLS